MSQNTLNDSEIFALFKKGEYSALKKLYPSLRGEFEGWAMKLYKMDTNEIMDIYQDAMITFYKNIASGKLTELRSSIKTYIFAIAKNLILKRFDKSRNRLTLVETEAELDWNAETKIQDEENLSHRQRVLKDALENLGNPCKQILTLFYYNRYSIEAIQYQMGYKHIDVVRTQKGRCIKKMKEEIKDKEL